MSIRIFVEGNPVPQPRHRVGRGRAYLKASEPVRGYKDAITVRAREAMRGPRILGPVAVVVVFVFERPKSYPKSKTVTWHPVKPDFDNLEKSVLDALKGIVYTDDSQIVSSRTWKVTADSFGRVSPGVYVCASPCGEDAESESASALEHFKGAANG